MRTVFAMVLVVGLLALGTGCGAIAWTPAGVTGTIYTDARTPGDISSNTAGTKVGTAEVTSILGWVATGDASVEAAARNAGITKIHTVDYHAYSVLGVYAKLTTRVSGE